MPYPICHVYAALHYSYDNGFVIGSIFPDTTHLLVKDKPHTLMKGFLKSLEKNPENKQFIAGIKFHIALDNYFHKNYIYPKRDILIKEFNLNPSAAEGYIEIALDKFIYKKHPRIIKLIRKAMKSLNIKSVSIPLSTALNHPLKPTRKALKSASRIVKLRKPYSIRTLLIKGLILRKYSRLKAIDLKLTKSAKIIKRAKQLIEKDYEQAIKKAINKIKPKDEFGIIKNI